MSIELKIKSKHLAEEARIIRVEENKLFKSIQWEKAQIKATGLNEPFIIENSSNYSTWKSIKTHRRWDVRNENRATFLARAFITGKPYRSVEQKRKPEREYTYWAFVIPRIVAMVNKYGNTTIDRKTIEEWSKLD